VLLFRVRKRGRGAGVLLFEVVKEGGLIIFLIIYFNDAMHLIKYISKKKEGQSEEK